MGPDEKLRQRRPFEVWARWREKKGVGGIVKGIEKGLFRITTRVEGGNLV